MDNKRDRQRKKYKRYNNRLSELGKFKKIRINYAKTNTSNLFVTEPLGHLEEKIYWIDNDIMPGGNDMTIPYECYQYRQYPETDWQGFLLSDYFDFKCTGNNWKRDLMQLNDMYND
jgi:hypothetical protein